MVPNLNVRDKRITSHCALLVSTCACIPCPSLIFFPMIGFLCCLPTAALHLFSGDCNSCHCLFWFFDVHDPYYSKHGRPNQRLMVNTLFRTVPCESCFSCFHLCHLIEIHSVFGILKIDIL